MGTGISSCLVIDRQPFLGARGATGTMASSPLPSSNSLEAAPRPTLEQLASGPALVSRFNQRGGAAKSGEDVLAAARAGDARALDVTQAAGEALGATCATRGRASS